MSIGNKIYELRVSNNLSQSDLADRLDVSRQSVSKWETDSSIPDLDKLIKMCDIFNVSLDDLTERGHNNDISVNRDTTPNSSISVIQKTFGILFFGLAALIGILSMIFGGWTEFLLLCFPIALTLLICSLICFLVKRQALYWCIWTGLSSVSFFTPRIIGIGLLSYFNLFQMIGMLIMGIVAIRIFKKSYVSVSKVKSILLLFSWMVIIPLYILNFYYFSSFLFLSFIFNYVLFALIAVLETYTVCYIINIIPNN